MKMKDQRSKVVRSRRIFHRPLPLVHSVAAETDLPKETHWAGTEASLPALRD